MKRYFAPETAIMKTLVQTAILGASGGVIFGGDDKILPGDSYNETE